MSERPDHLGPSYRLPSPPPPDPTGWIELRRKARAAVWPPQPVAWAALLAVAVAVAGLHGLWFQVTLAGRLPSATAWTAAASILSREARPGDAVALAPAWAERAREVLPEHVPSRPDAHVPVLAFPSLAEGAEDLAGVRRVWLVSLPEAPGGAGRIAAELASRSAAVEPPLRLGRLELTRYDLRSPMVPLYAFRDHLPSAAVGGTPSRVARETREVAGLPRTCIVAAIAAPPTGTAAAGAPEPATIRFRDVPLGRALRGHVGLVGDAPPTTRPVSIRVKVDGAEVARAEARAGSGWTPFQVDTAPLHSPAREVELEIAAAGPLPRGVCVDVVTLP